MEEEEFRISKNNFKYYIKALLELETIFEKYNQNIKAKDSITLKETGYLIDKKNFDDIKEKLFYNEFKIYINDYVKFEQMMKEKYEYMIPYIPFEQKIFNSSQELLICFQKNKEYIIINKLVWKLMNNGKYKEDEGKIIYEINNEILTIYFNAEDKINFNYNFNFISNQNLIQKKIIDDRKSNFSKLALKDNIIKRNIRYIDNYIKLL